MIIDSPHKHLTDQEFFTHIKLFSLIFKIGDAEDGYDNDDTFQFSDLVIGYEDPSEIYNRICLGADVLNATVFIKKDSYSDNAVTEAKKRVETRPEKDRAGLLKIIKDIEDGKKIKFSDVGKVSWVWYEIYSSVRFTPLEYKIPKEIQTMFQMEIDKYLESFINDRLAISTKNYYKFQAQKRVLIKLIEEDKKIELYGNNFIIREKVDSKCVMERAQDFSIIQAVYALQKMGYLKVVDVWDDVEYPDSSYSSSTRDPKRYLNVNVILEEAFIAEINNSYKKDNPKHQLQSFDAKKGILKFAEQEIELSKKGKQTDAVLLMQTLMKAKGDAWSHNDEILADWGYNDDDQKGLAKNKVYFAGQKINTTVAIKTKIEDLIECNTSKARINPKYKSVDG